MKLSLVVASAALAIGVGFYLGWKIRPPDRPSFPVVITDTVYLNRERPTPQIPLLGKIRWRTVPPVTRATGPLGQTDTAAVRQYCRTWAGLSSRDTTQPDTATRPTPRAVLPDFRGRRSGSKLQLWSTLSDGRAYYDERRVRGDRMTWLSHGDSTIYREERLPFFLFRGLPGTLFKFGLGFATGVVVWELAK